MRLSIRTIPDPILRQKCELVDLRDPTLEQFIVDMRETMTDSKGIGLAANQVGRSICLFILAETEHIDPFEVFINPEIIELGELVPFETEACLSIPGTHAPTKRASWLVLRWFSTDGNLHERRFEDMRSFAVQHEMDHLNGKLYIDQLGPVRRQLTLDKHKKFVRVRGV
jgi:peptide deformylase